MQAIHDVDALLLLAMSLAAKRRSAELIEIIAAIDLIHGAQGIIPSESRLNEAFQRLSANGMICAVEDRFTLTPAAQLIMTGIPRKADTAARIQSLKDRFLASAPEGEHATLLLTNKQICAAILLHRAAGKSSVKNLLIPKPQTAGGDIKPGQRQRKPLPAKRRKD